MQLGSIMIMAAYYVGKVHNMLPWQYHDNIHTIDAFF